MCECKHSYELKEIEVGNTKSTISHCSLCGDYQQICIHEYKLLNKYKLEKSSAGGYIYRDIFRYTETHRCDKCGDVIVIEIE